MSTLLEMLNDVLGEAGFLEKSSFGDSPDPDDKQMVIMANRVAEDIRSFYDWSLLSKSFNIVLVSGQQDYPLPDDYYSVTADSAWETDGSRKVDFPVPKNRWFMYKFSSLTDAGTVRARLYGNVIQINDPAVASAIDLEYVSKYVVTDSAGNPKEKFTKDTDLFILDDEMLIKGVKARWAGTKMMPMAKDWKQEFKEELRYHVGLDNSGQTIGGGPTRDRRGPYYPLWRAT